MKFSVCICIIYLDQTIRHQLQYCGSNTYNSKCRSVVLLYSPCRSRKAQLCGCDVGARFQRKTLNIHARRWALRSIVWSAVAAARARSLDIVAKPPRLLNASAACQCALHDADRRTGAHGAASQHLLNAHAPAAPSHAAAAAASRHNDAGVHGAAVCIGAAAAAVDDDDDGNE